MSDTNTSFSFAFRHKERPFVPQTVVLNNMFAKLMYVEYDEWRTPCSAGNLPLLAASN